MPRVRVDAGQHGDCGYAPANALLIKTTTRGWCLPVSRADRLAKTHPRRHAMATAVAQRAISCAPRRIADCRAEPLAMIRRHISHRGLDGEDFREYAPNAAPNLSLVPASSLHSRVPREAGGYTHQSPPRRSAHLPGTRPVATVAASSSLHPLLMAIKLPTCSASSATRAPPKMADAQDGLGDPRQPGNSGSCSGDNVRAGHEHTRAVPGSESQRTTAHLGSGL